MRNLFIFILTISSFFASGQSARKQNKHLKVEYAALVKEYTKLFDHYDSLSVDTKNARESLLKKKKELEQQHNLIKEYIDVCLRNYDMVVNLESTKDITFSRTAIESMELPELLISQLTDLEKRLIMPDLTRRNYPNNMHCKIKNKQNYEYLSHIQRLKEDTLMLSKSITDIKIIREFSETYIPIYDSLINIIRVRTLDLNTKSNAIINAFITARNSYESKGPKGFNAYYAEYFPGFFPSDKVIKTDVAVSNGHIQKYYFQEDETKSIKDPNIYEKVDELADYSGGEAELNSFLKANIRYPENVKLKKIEGECILRFLVSENGYISNVKILKEVPDCPECDKEAIRVVKSMPKWKPAKINGKAVNSYYTLPITFKL